MEPFYNFKEGWPLNIHSYHTSKRNKGNQTFPRDISSHLMHFICEKLIFGKNRWWYFFWEVSRYHLNAVVKKIKKHKELIMGSANFTCKNCLFSVSVSFFFSQRRVDHLWELWLGWICRCWGWSLACVFIPSSLHFLTLTPIPNYPD